MWNIQTKPKSRHKTGPVLPFHNCVGTKLWISSRRVLFLLISLSRFTLWDLDIVGLYEFQQESQANLDQAIQNIIKCEKPVLVIGNLIFAILLDIKILLRTSWKKISSNNKSTNQHIFDHIFEALEEHLSALQKIKVNTTQTTNLSI